MEQMLILMYMLTQKYKYLNDKLQKWKRLDTQENQQVINKAEVRNIVCLFVNIYVGKNMFREKKIVE